MFRKLFGLVCAILFLAAAASLQAQYATLHSFLGAPADGETPDGNLVRKGTVLYGMTFAGGANNLGGIFRINADGSAIAWLHFFTVDALDGRNPFGSLLLYKNKLYGMTHLGGSSDKGTVFRMNLDGSGFAVLHAFAGGAADGERPFGSLARRGGVLYGMTFYGGSNNLGTLFKIKNDGTGFTLLHTFGGTGDGAKPRGALVSSGSRLYGLTAEGGAKNAGTIFQINPNGSGYAILHSFTAGTAGGIYPQRGTVLAKGAALYGLTSKGGENNQGVIFKIKKNGTGFTVLHSFGGDAANGTCPYGSLTFGKGKLYGLTMTGGPDDDGTIFRINPDGSGFEQLHAFVHTAGEGENPRSDLLFSASAKTGIVLTGMTRYGGTADLGTIFSFKID